MRMLPPFGLWLINLIMSKEFYITSLDNNMNRGTFQGFFAFFFNSKNEILNSTTTFGGGIYSRTVKVYSFI